MSSSNPNKHASPHHSKKHAILDTLLNFGKSTYVPLTPIEIMPGVMSTDGVATVFQLDTRKPRKVKASSSSNARAASMSAQQPARWVDALRPPSTHQPDYFTPEDVGRMKEHHGRRSFSHAAVET